MKRRRSSASSTIKTERRPSRTDAMSELKYASSSGASTESSGPTIGGSNSRLITASMSLGISTINLQDPNQESTAPNSNGPTQNCPLHTTIDRRDFQFHLAR